MAPNATEGAKHKGNSKLSVISYDSNNNDICEHISKVTLKTDDISVRPPASYKWEYKWSNIFLITFFHAGTIYGLLMFPYIEKWRTVIFFMISMFAAGFGLTAGAHRLWTHRSYKANFPLRVILMVLFTAAGHDSIFNWVRDHRIHHKFSETDADPHNAARGFFFSHVGWLMVKKHPEVIAKGRQIDMSDIVADPIARFNSKYFFILRPLICFIIPTLMVRYTCDESWTWSILTQCFMRYILLVNFTWLVNSAAHIYGSRPYDTKIGPTENNLVSFLGLGEGWHNYHHTFPWDYKMAEFTDTLNFTGGALNLCGKIGWAYDFKVASPELIKKVSEKWGDGSRAQWDEMSEEYAQILSKS